METANTINLNIHQFHSLLRIILINGKLLVFENTAKFQFNSIYFIN